MALKIQLNYYIDLDFIVIIKTFIKTCLHYDHCIKLLKLICMYFSIVLIIV